MNTQRKERATGGDRKYMGLAHPIKFCDSYDKRRMACGAQDGSCGCQYVDPGWLKEQLEYSKSKTADWPEWRKDSIKE